MKVDIVVVYVQRYECGHEKNFVPPITGIHLAAITPAEHEIRVIHQQVEQPDLNTDADVVALSFFSGFAPEAYRLATEYRKRGKTVVEVSGQFRRARRIQRDQPTRPRRNAPKPD